MPLSETQLKGRQTEIGVINSFLQAGYNVAEPYVADRYDLIVDINGRLLKIQIKTSRITETGTIVFSTKNIHINTTGTCYKNYKNDNIDFFATMYKNQCYLVPVQECGVSNCALRIEKPKNNATKNIRFIEDYTLEKQLESYA